MRKNEKQELVINYENSIKKSNELSMAKLNSGLTLNQMQLLAYAIYATQQKNKTEFHKADFEKMFKLEKYQTKHAKEDVPKLSRLQFSVVDLEKNVVDYLNIFQRIRYDNGLFTFKWADDMVPHILGLEKYNLVDLDVKSKFKSSFSWTLYDYLKAHYGYWHKPITKEALMKLFCVEDKKTYQNNTGDFKKTVLDVAIAEINDLTELEVRYTENKEGRSIVGFDLIWSNGPTSPSATKKQIREIKAIVDIVFEDVFKYVNLKNDENRQRAVDLVKEIEEMRGFTIEPICITKEKADFTIQKANSNLRELEQMLGEEQQSKPKFYNWLEERE